MGRLAIVVRGATSRLAAVLRRCRSAIRRVMRAIARGRRRPPDRRRWQTVTDAHGTVVAVWRDLDEDELRELQRPPQNENENWLYRHRSWRRRF
jgi:hypothetical protein